MWTSIERTLVPRHWLKSLGRKHNFSVVVTDQPVALTGTMWDGGSRAEWCELNLVTGYTQSVQYVNPDEDRSLPFGNIQRSGQPTKGTAIVSAGIFCGKAATPRIYITWEDVKEHLPELKSTEY